MYRFLSRISSSGTRQKDAHYYCSVLAITALTTQQRRSSTLYKGIKDVEEKWKDPKRPHPGVSPQLGASFAVKMDARAAHTQDADGGRESRSFDDVLKAVDAMTSGRKPNRCPDNLVLTQRLIERLQLRPALEKLRFVHIAGTKGKGTTAAYTAALLKGYGFKVGLFTSPHLVDVRERTVVDGEMLPKDTYAKHFFDFKRRYDALKHSESEYDRDIASSRANFFRFIFLFSLYVFAEEQVEVAVMEVGLGGRIDATNVICPDVCVITSLGWDHMSILGNTLEEISREKAGILKEGVVCFASPQKDHPETRKVLEKCAAEVQAPLVLLDASIFPLRSWPLLAIGGSHAVENSKLALMAARKVADIPPIAPLDESERNILQRMTYAGRSQIVKVKGDAVYLDGAHTPESILAATKWFIQASDDLAKREAQKAGATGDDGKEPRRVLVLYSSREPKQILKSFMPFISKFSKVVITPVFNASLAQQRYDSNGQTDQETLLNNIAQEEALNLSESWRDLYREVPCIPCTAPFENLDELLDIVLPSAGPTDDASQQAHIFVTGSFYLVGHILSLINSHDPQG